MILRACDVSIFVRLIARMSQVYLTSRSQKGSAWASQNERPRAAIDH
jgi:hypothetical protein